MKECEFQDRLVDRLRQRKCWVKCLVGSTLMAGLPDLMVINQSNKLFFIENKMWRLKRNPSSDDLFNLLDGPQRNVIPNDLWARKQDCWIAALDNRDEETIWTTNGDGFSYRFEFEEFVRSAST